MNCALMDIVTCPCSPKPPQFCLKISLSSRLHCQDTNENVLFSQDVVLFLSQIFKRNMFKWPSAGFNGVAQHLKCFVGFQQVIFCFFLWGTKRYMEIKSPLNLNSPTSLFFVSETEAKCNASNMEIFFHKTRTS